MAQGVFSLIEVRTEQVSNIANKDFASWPEVNNYGYFFDTGAPQAIYRLNFFDETATVLQNTNPVAFNKTQTSATISTPQYMFIACGNNTCTISRIDFSAELISLPTQNFSSIRQNLASAWNDNYNYGYFAGGDNSVSNVSTITRLDFSTETVNNSTTAFFNPVRNYVSGTSSNSYGYFAGGNSPSINTITRLDFSNETVSDPAKNLPIGRANLRALQTNNYGYFGGGTPSGTAGSVTNIYKLDFSSESLTTLSSFVTKGGIDGCASASGYTQGYFTTPGPSDPVDRLNFSTDTVVNLTLNTINWGNGLVGSNSQGSKKIAQETPKTYGYFGGGVSGGTTPYLVSVERLDLSTETITNPGNNLPTAVRYLASVSDNNYGYYTGGQNPPLPSLVQDVIMRFDFSTEVSNQLASVLPSARYQHSGTSSNSYGYFIGGSDSGGSSITTCSRIDFSTDTSSNPNKNLALVTYGIAATSSNSYGYFGGGNHNNAILCNIYRLDFSTETLVDSSTAKLSTAKYSLAATSSNSYGYFGGGIPPNTGVSSMDRLDFSVDTVSPISPLGRNTNEFAAASSSSFGYFGGGDSPTTPSSASINRLNFSTDTSTTLSSVLGTARQTHAAVSNSN